MEATTRGSIRRSASVGCRGSQTADQVKSDVVKLGGIGASSPYYDPTAFASVTQVRYGTSGRNILRGPGLVNLDGAIFRNFRLRERLGKHQDLLVLEQLAGAHQPLAPWRSRLAPAIASRKAEHVAASRRLALRLFVEKPRAFRRRLEVMWDTSRPKPASPL